VQRLAGQLLLEAAPLGDVPARQHHAALAPVADEVAAEGLHPPRRAVGGPEPQLDAARLRAGERGGEVGGQARPVVGVHDVGERGVDQVLRGDAEEPLHRRALVRDDPVRAQQRDQVGAALHERAEPLLSPLAGVALGELLHEVGHAGHDERRQHDERRRDGADVDGVAAQPLDDEHARGDEGGGGERGRAQWRQARGARRTVRGGGHRGVRRRHPPAGDPQHPAAVDPRPDRPGAGDDLRAVHDVADEQRHHPGAQEEERDGTGARGEPEAGQHREHGEVGQGVGDGDQLGARARLAVTQRRQHEQHPHREPEPGRERHGVDEAPALRAAAVPHEQHQRGHHQRVGGQVEQVVPGGGGREDARHRRVAVGDRVTDGEARQAGREQHPRQPVLRPVEPHPQQHDGRRAELQRDQQRDPGRGTPGQEVGGTQAHGDQAVHPPEPTLHLCGVGRLRPATRPPIG
jgi:hypothetical protein